MDAATSLGSWYIVTFFSFLSEMILQNDFELQKRGHVFSLVLKIQLVSNNLNKNKNPMIFCSKSFLEFC